MQEVSLLQKRASEVWAGSEKLAVIEITRALDLAATVRYLATEELIGDGRAMEFRHMLGGATFALQPFLPSMQGCTRGVPWGASTDGTTAFMQSYLYNCGILTSLLRLAGLERYGLAKTTVVSDNRLIIEVSEGQPELSTLQAMLEWREQRYASNAPSRSETRMASRLHKRMFRYVDRDPTHLIRYGNDLEIVEFYLRKAQRIGLQFFEGEALPSETIIGGRTFADWRHACDQALGRILFHIDFAQLLCKKHPSTMLRDVLTIFARREDVASVWVEAGMSVGDVDATMRALDLTGDALSDWEHAYETPTPFYIDLGRDFVLLPCFGALSNPYFALFRHLRTVYRKDWDRGLNRREKIFRDDLESVLSGQGLHVLKTGFKIRRQDGSHITDIDAVIRDDRNGRIALVQLKWHDIFGRSLSERDSRRRNLREASEWVEKVCSWAAGRTSDKVAKALGISNPDLGQSPILIVMTRYAAYFSGENDLDERATWLAWPELLRALRSYDGKDLLADLADILRVHREITQGTTDINEMYQFRDLTVELKIGSGR
jgi:PAS domain-containing protein